MNLYNQIDKPLLIQIVSIGLVPCSYVKKGSFTKRLEVKLASSRKTYKVFIKIQTPTMIFDDWGTPSIPDSDHNQDTALEVRNGMVYTVHRNQPYPKFVFRNMRGKVVDDEIVLSWWDSR